MENSSNFQIGDRVRIQGKTIGRTEEWMFGIIKNMAEDKASVVLFNGFFCTVNKNYLEKRDFTIADLKNGMVVEFGFTKSKYVLLGNRFLSSMDYTESEHITDDLRDEKHLNENEYGIMAVYLTNYKDCCCLDDIFEDDNLELLWKRPDLLPDISCNIDINFDGKDLYIAEASSSGCKYTISNKKELLETICNYIADIVDTDNEFTITVN